MKILRLLLFKTCNRSCEGCCNKDWDLENLEIETDYAQYDLILLTGGEPMIMPGIVHNAITDIRNQTQVPIYLYTAFIQPELQNILRRIDGITLTLHEQLDADLFDLHKEELEQEGKSLRLNVFKEVDINGIDTTFWKVQKDIVWIKDCPLPENEVFKRYIK